MSLDRFILFKKVVCINLLNFSFEWFVKKGEKLTSNLLTITRLQKIFIFVPFERFLKNIRNAIIGKLMEQGLSAKVDPKKCNSTVNFSKINFGK